MSFFNRKWTDAEKWAMGIAAALLIAGLLAIPQFLGGDVTLEVASKRDAFGRCIDTELLLRNRTKNDATEIKIVFDVDFFTRQGTVAAEYGDERDQLIPPSQQSLLPRGPYTPISYEMDPRTSVLTVPKLQPGESIHIFFGGETVLEGERAAARERLLMAKEPDLMDKPRVKSAHRKDGKVKLIRTVTCAP